MLRKPEKPLIFWAVEAALSLATRLHYLMAQAYRSNPGRLIERGETKMAIQKKSLMSNLNSTKKSAPASNAAASDGPIASRAMLSKTVASRMVASKAPTVSLSKAPTVSLSKAPTVSLSKAPTVSLSKAPTVSLSKAPTVSLSKTIVL
jgi:hypothetical protein